MTSEAEVGGTLVHRSDGEGAITAEITCRSFGSPTSGDKAPVFNARRRFKNINDVTLSMFLTK